ncbi:hypothetical protein OH77DRAFT_1411302 [Trametes cingulata]|nr:hypothetical protein OH77DRAFT_1411302 [Trametes cingulata]
MARIFNGQHYQSLSRSSARCRVLCVFITAVVLLSTWLILWSETLLSGVWRPFSTHNPHPSTPHPDPPLFPEYHQKELLLPQHKWNQTHPGPDDKFFFVAGHARCWAGQGWGNSLQEILLNAYLASRLNRTYVFDNYTWAAQPTPYTDYKGKKIPSQIPYSVSLRGPIVGEPFPPGNHPPPAVSKTYYEHICPTPVDIRHDEVLSSPETPHTVETVVEAWSNKLQAIDAPCVQSARHVGPIFTHPNTFGARGSMESIWNDFSTSPIMTHFGWSPLIELGFDTNRELFLPAHSLATEPFLSTVPFTTNADRYSMIPGLMVIHVRRGDYDTHCRYLAEQYEDFVSVNTFPSMMDRFTIPPFKVRGKTTSANREYYRKHCYPSVSEISAKVADILNTPAARGVRKLFIMTNADRKWIANLKDVLWGVAHWEMISSSRDVTVSWEQKYVAQCIDALVAQRAQVFIGNGFSTLTSTLVTMRLANGLPPDSTRLW